MSLPKPLADKRDDLARKYKWSSEFVDGTDWMYAEMMKTKDMEIENLKSALESFKTARIMSGPGDTKQYIHNHEVAHSALKLLEGDK